MAVYDDRLRKHAVWVSLDGARASLETAKGKFANPQQVETGAHFDAILTFLEQRLKGLDAQLVPFSVLDQINGNLGQLSQLLTQFVGNSLPRALDRADAPADGILAFLAQLPVVGSDGVEGLQEIGERYRRSMSAQTGAVTKEVESLRGKLTEVEQQAAKQGEEIAAEAGRLDEAVKEANTAFEDAQRERDTRFAERLQGLETDTTATLEGVKKQSEEAWEEIAAIKERAQVASTYLGIKALAGGYHDTAEVEDRRAMWTRWGAIASLLVAAAGPVFALVYHVVHSFSVDGFLTKSVVALPFLLIAGYLGRESSKHGDRAHFNRQRQRQLESLPAYVNGVAPEKRGELYEALAPGFFSPAIATTKDGKSEDDALGALIRLLLDEIRKRG